MILGYLCSLLFLTFPVAVLSGMGAWHHLERRRDGEQNGQMGNNDGPAAHNTQIHQIGRGTKAVEMDSCEAEQEKKGFVPAYLLGCLREQSNDQCWSVQRLESNVTASRAGGFGQTSTRARPASIQAGWMSS